MIFQEVSSDKKLKCLSKYLNTINVRIQKKSSSMMWKTRYRKDIKLQSNSKNRFKRPFNQGWPDLLQEVFSHRGMNTRGENWLLWKGPTVCCLMCVLCHNVWTNYDLDLFSTSKWPSELQFCERYLCRWRKIG